MSKKPFIAIIGNRNAGKSTIIRCLTGAPSSQFRGQIENKATNKNIEVIGSSPQEDDLSLPDLKNILSGAQNSTSCNGVVCAIQPNWPRVRLSLEDIMREALNHNFIVYAFILDPEYNGNQGHATSIINRISSINNKIITSVLDARCFGYINAEIINNQTKIMI